jgi:hypothetical protein
MLTSRVPDTVRRLIEADACADAAIALFRDALPEYGFKLVMSPPLEGSLKSFASAWRRGDAWASFHHAASPSLALLQAAAHECARSRETALHLACCECSGLGWFVSATGTREICLHARN